MRETRLRVKVLRPASGNSRAARVEPCHWSEGCAGVSLRARWDATLVYLIMLSINAVET